MQKQQFYQVVPTILGCVALSIAVGRCSPIAPSFYKTNGGPTSTTLPGTVGGTQLQYQTQVLDSTSYASATSSASNTIVLSSSSNTALFNEFRTHGRTEIAISTSSGLPEQGEGFFEVTYSQADISSDGLSGFSTSATFTSSGTLVLAVNPSVSADVSQEVLSSLQSVTISFNVPVSSVGTTAGASTSSHSAESVTGPTGQSGPTGVSGPTGTTGSSGAR
jgi:hypothetical protein